METMFDMVRLLHAGLSGHRLRDAVLKHGTESTLALTRYGARWMFRIPRSSMPFLSSIV